MANTLRLYFVNIYRRPSSKRRLAAFLLFITPAVPSAEELNLSKLHADCMSRAEGNRAAIYDCYSVEFPIQDTRLNTVYKKLYAELDQDQKSALREAQRDWIKSRDSTCGLTVRLYHNSWARFISEPWCRTEETARRADFLKTITHGDNDAGVSGSKGTTPLPTQTEMAKPPQNNLTQDPAVTPNDNLPSKQLGARNNQDAVSKETDLSALCSQYDGTIAQGKMLDIASGRSGYDQNAPNSPTITIPECGKIVYFYDKIISDSNYLKLPALQTESRDLFGKSVDEFTSTDVAKISDALRPCLSQGISPRRPQTLAFQTKLQIGIHAKELARFAQQRQLCPEWQKQQDVKKKERFVSDLRGTLLNNKNCASVANSIRDATDKLVGYPQLDQQIELAQMQLALGEKGNYCKIVSEIATPYLRLRHIVALCDAEMAYSLNASFGSLMDEARQNGCR
ncbi:lysozyme inhibitor LprI family protein [Methylobacterium longum]|uniref:Lysozyme inhibitor LprI family protein n=1 Tax=Methylobacterium longum TaxID=767694 RepID=A0ABT8ARC4_9HYPH|nr:lysozyme inhibitor LprI family protein [Methylobacterium longum]MDN3572096.1 lysozyme inhibitor LprI family protein [Methylobacterium longum]